MTRKLSVFLHSVNAGLLEQDDAANLTFTDYGVKRGKGMSRAISANHCAFGRACLHELDRPMATHAH